MRPFLVLRQMASLLFYEVPESIRWSTVGTRARARASTVRQGDIPVLRRLVVRVTKQPDDAQSEARELSPALVDMEVRPD